MVVQSLEIFINLYCGSHDAGEKNTHVPTFVIENSPNSLGHNSVFIDPNDFKFGIEICCMFSHTTTKFGTN